MSMPAATARRAIAADALVAFGHALLRESGVRDDIARDVATVLVDGDLLGHTTHGLALLPAYLAEIDKGTMAKSGEPVVVNARAGRAGVGRRAPAGTVAHAARARRRDGDGATPAAPAPSSSAARTTSRASPRTCGARPTAA